MSWSSILIDQFKNVLIVILLVGAAPSYFLGHGVESLVITVSFSSPLDSDLSRSIELSGL